jgi:four helix bundle protein
MEKGEWTRDNEEDEMSQNVIVEKSYAFALRVVRLYRYLCDEKKEYVLSRKLLNTGTDIGAHVKAAQEAEAKPGFVHEMSLALQLTSQTEYWLQLLQEADYLEPEQFTSIQADCLDLIRLLTAIVKSAKGLR